MGKENISESPLLKLKDPEVRNRIHKRGKELVEFVKISNFETLVFIDRSARPISWIFDAFWMKFLPDDIKPDSIFLYLGQKDLRRKYIDGIGSAISETGHQFVGIYDTKENISLFQQRVREDKKTLRRIKRELGEKGVKNLRDRKVLIIDESEFEGVSRLFAEEVIDEVFSPSLIKYWEWGGHWDFYDIPTGLSRKKSKSFIAKESERSLDIEVSQMTRNEIINLANEL